MQWLHARLTGMRCCQAMALHGRYRCVPLITCQWAKLYTRNSLRGGVPNHTRKLGIANAGHRRLGGWMTIVAARGYRAMSAREK